MFLVNIQINDWLSLFFSLADNRPCTRADRPDSRIPELSRLSHARQEARPQVCDAPPAAARLSPNDRTRVARALEVVEATGRPLADWQAQGLPALILGFITPWYLSDRPSDAGWLEPEEREWLIRELAQEAAFKRTHRPTTVRQALTSRYVLVLSAALCLIVLASYGYIFWLPTTIQQHSGRSNVQSKFNLG